mgnify:CR=1 FL=1
MKNKHLKQYGILNLNSKWTLFLGQESDEDSVASSAAEKNIMELLLAAEAKKRDNSNKQEQEISMRPGHNQGYIFFAIF